MTRLTTTTINFNRTITGIEHGTLELNLQKRGFLFSEPHRYPRKEEVSDWCDLNQTCRRYLLSQPNRVSSWRLFLNLPFSSIIITAMNPTQTTVTTLSKKRLIIVYGQHSRISLHLPTALGFRTTPPSLASSTYQPSYIPLAYLWPGTNSGWVLSTPAAELVHTVLFPHEGLGRRGAQH